MWTKPHKGLFRKDEGSIVKCPTKVKLSTVIKQINY